MAADRPDARIEVQPDGPYEARRGVARCRCGGRPTSRSVTAATPRAAPATELIHLLEISQAR